MVRAICGIQLKDRKRAKDLILMMDLNETIDQLALTNSFLCHGHVLRIEDDYVFKRVL